MTAWYFFLIDLVLTAVVVGLFQVMSPVRRAEAGSARRPSGHLQSRWPRIPLPWERPVATPQARQGLPLRSAAVLAGRGVISGKRLERG